MARKKAGSRKAKRVAEKRGGFNALHHPPARRVRKNIDMDPAKLAAVKKILGASTETEAVDRAFDEIIFEHKVGVGLERLAEAGGLPNVDPEA